MTDINIKSKKLFSYLNPLQDLLPGQDWVYNKQAITNRILRGDIYYDDEDDLIANNYRKIAYFVSYPQDLFVKLSIPKTQEDLKTMLVDEHDNVLVYTALAYLNADVISADLEGDKVFAKTFFNIASKENFAFKKEAITCNNVSREIDWVVNEKLLVDSWRDKEFVLQNLTADNIHINSKLVPAEFWNDAGFFKQFMKKYIESDINTHSLFNYALKEHKYNEHFLNYVMNQYQSFDIFKTHYYKEYLQYKEGNTIHPNQHILDNLFTKPANLYKWMRNLYNTEIIIACFPTDMLQSKDTIIESYVLELEQTLTSFKPLPSHTRSYSYSNEQPNFIAEKDSKWKLDLYDSLIDTFVKHCQRGGNYRRGEQSFSDSYSFLLFDSIDISQDFIDLIKDMPSFKKDIYMQALNKYCRTNDVVLGKAVSDMIINEYPQYFSLLGQEYRTLENLKQLVHYKTNITSEELLQFNDKELNLAVIDSNFYNLFLTTFPISYIKDEDYLVALINKKSSFISDNKSLVKYIEGNDKLVKTFIDQGFYRKLSPKLFEDLTLSEYLVGHMFKQSNRGKYSTSELNNISSLVNPIVFSNIESLEKILTLSYGAFLKEVPHLFKHKPFVKMVFKLYDENKIDNLELLPAKVRLILDSYQVHNNFESFFIKYELQKTLNNKLIDNKTVQKAKHKI